MFCRRSISISNWHHLYVVLYSVLETEVSFRPSLTCSNKKSEVFIPPSWVQLDYVVVVIHEYLLKQTEFGGSAGSHRWLRQRESGSRRNLCSQRDLVMRYIYIYIWFSTYNMQMPCLYLPLPRPDITVSVAKRQLQLLTPPVALGYFFGLSCRPAHCLLFPLMKSRWLCSF